MLKTWWLPYFQDEVPIHDYHVMINCHVFFTANQPNLISLSFPTPHPGAILNLLSFLEWPTLLPAYQCLPMLFTSYGRSLVSPFPLAFLWQTVQPSRFSSHVTHGNLLNPALSYPPLLTLLAEFGASPTAYLCGSTCYTTLVVTICLLVSAAKTGSFMRGNKVKLLGTQVRCRVRPECGSLLYHHCVTVGKFLHFSMLYFPHL